MFQFPDNEEEPINSFTITLALISIAAALIGALLLLFPARSAFLKMMESAPKKMRLIIIEPDDCWDCFGITQVTDFLKNLQRLKYSPIKKYKASDSKAELLVKAYGIKVLPTFILQGEINGLKLYEIFSSRNIGKLEDRVFVYANYFPPYYDVEKKTIKGRFNLIYLTDSSCAECYDVRLHDKVLNNLAMKPSFLSTVDVASGEGRDYIKKYGVRYAPTILLKGDMDTYENFKQVWQTVGKVEDDGTYVFRGKGLVMMGKYKDLQTGNVTGYKQ